MTDSVRARDVFKIGLDEHVTVAGATGTGKSYGAMKLMRGQKKPFVIYDSKASGTVAQFADRIITRPDDLDTIGRDPEKPYEKVAYRPAWDASEDEIRETANAIARWCYLRGNIGLYIDEMSDVSRNAVDALPYLRGLAVRGRERHATLWATTQRPVGIPKILLSEAAHYLIFQLRDPSDRDRIAQACEHPIQSRIQQLPDYQFLYVEAKKGRVSGPFHF